MKYIMILRLNANSVKNIISSYQNKLENLAITADLLAYFK